MALAAGLTTIAAASGCGATGGHKSLSDIKLAAASGDAVQPLQARHQRASVLIFITADCPISNGYAPEINSIVAGYAASNIDFWLVHVDQNFSAQEARKHAAEYGYRCPVLLDPALQLVRASGATVTPEVAVFSYQTNQLKDDAVGASSRAAVEPSLAYLGRIDDRYIDFGKRRFEPTQRDLRETLDALIQGRPVPASRTRAVGCPIPEIK